MSCRHALGHRAPQAAQGLGGSAVGQALGGPFHIRTRDEAAGSRGFDQLEIDVELACKRTHCRKRLSFLSNRRLGKCCRSRRLLAGAEFADNCAGVLLGSFGKFDERPAYFHHISLGAKQVQDASARWRRHLDDGLVGLDGYQRLIGDDVIAFVDMPVHDLRLFEALSQIRQYELAHGISPLKIN